MEKEAFILLIESIKKSSGLTEKQISKQMGYDEGHIAQIKNRGPISDKFVNALKREFGVGEKEYPEPFKSSVVEEDEAHYGHSNNPDYLIDIIKTQAETILVQQKMLSSLVGQASQKTA